MSESKVEAGELSNAGLLSKETYDSLVRDAMLWRHQQSRPSPAANTEGLREALMKARAALVALGADFKDEEVTDGGAIDIDDIDPEYITARNAVEEIDAALRASPSAPSEGGWIPVSERLPDEWQFCGLVAIQGYSEFSVMEAAFAEGKWWIDGKHVDVTHWMPFPEPPRTPEPPQGGGV